MTGRSFRRPRTLQRRTVVCTVIACLASWFLLGHEDSSQIDPRFTLVPAGTYNVAHIAEDGTLELAIPIDGQHHRLRLHLLGIKIVDKQGASECSNEVIAGHKVRVRFDRRRLNEQNELQAYVFRQGYNAE